MIQNIRRDLRERDIRREQDIRSLTKKIEESNMEIASLSDAIGKSASANAGRRIVLKTASCGEHICGSDSTLVPAFHFTSVRLLIPICGG